MGVDAFNFALSAHGVLLAFQPQVGHTIDILFPKYPILMFLPLNMAIDCLFSFLLTDCQLLKLDRVENPPQWALNGWDSQSHVLAHRYSKMETQASIFPHKILNSRVLDQVKISLDHYVGREWWVTHLAYLLKLHDCLKVGDFIEKIGRLGGVGSLRSCRQ